MQYQANSPQEYIAQLPEDRKLVLEKLRNLITKSLPKGFEEGMSYNMISYYVPIPFIQTDIIAIQNYPYLLST